MQFCCITPTAKYWPHDTIVKLGAEMRNLCRLNELKKRFCLSDLIWDPFLSSQGSFSLPTSHSWRLCNFICMEQLLYSIGHEWFHPLELAPSSWHGIVRAHINENPCSRGGFVVFTPHSLVFLFTRSPDRRSDYWSNREAAIFHSLWKAWWELPTSGRERKYKTCLLWPHQPTHNS